MPLLTLLLPGIDMNDPHKASASLMFVSLMSHCVPLIDSSAMMTPEQESEDDLLCRLGTAGFEDWMRAFLGRILTLFENLPDQHASANSGQQNSETSLMEMVTVCSLFCPDSGTIELILLRNSSHARPSSIKLVQHFMQLP